MLLVLYIVFQIIYENTLLTKIFCVAYSIFSDLICLIFLIVGLQIKKYLLDEEKNTEEGNAIFDHTRITQINIMIYSFLPCSFYQTIYVSYREFFIYNEFKSTKFFSIPITLKAFILNLITIITELLLTIFTYYAFYWLVKKDYKKRPEIKPTIIFDQEKETETKKELDKFLCDDQIVPGSYISNSPKKKFQILSESFDSSI